MIIKTEIRKDYICQLIISDGNTKITEDVAIRRNGQYEVDDTIIEDLITAANDFSRFNKNNDVDFVKWIADHFLNDSEKVELIESLQTPKP